MGERKPPTVYECPFLQGEHGVICTTPITEEQYHEFCREIPRQPKDPNYLRCNAYKRYAQSPIMTMRRIYSHDMDVAHGQARKSQDKV